MTQMDQFGARTGVQEKVSAAKDVAADVGSTARDRAGDVATTAGTAAADVARTAEQQVGAVAGEAARHARDLTGELRTQLGEQASAQAQRLASSVRSLADELDDMASSRRDGGMTVEVVQQVAGKARDVASYVESRQPGELVDELRALARRRPGTFLLGALGLGLVAGRVARGTTQAAADQSPMGGDRMEPYPAEPPDRFGTVVSGAGTGQSTTSGQDFGAVTTTGADTGMGVTPGSDVGTPASGYGGYGGDGSGGGYATGPGMPGVGQGSAPYGGA